MIHLSCWAQRWLVTLRIFASAVQLYTHFIDEATNSPVLADGLAHGTTGQTTNSDDHESTSKSKPTTETLCRESWQTKSATACLAETVDTEPAITNSRSGPFCRSFVLLFVPPQRPFTRWILTMQDTRLLHCLPSICSNMYYSIGFCNPHRHFKAWLAEPSVTNTAFWSYSWTCFLNRVNIRPKFPVASWPSTLHLSRISGC